MTILSKIKAKTLQLRKEKSQYAPTMQFHISQLTNIGKNSNRETTEDETISYLKKTAQKLKDNPYHDAGELALIEVFLPEMVSENDVKEFLSTIDLNNKGMVMKEVKGKFGNLVDMKMVNNLVEEMKG